METAPCKYFQKGNCKFGVKCALAHILPDGRRVNPKSLAQVYQSANNKSEYSASPQNIVSPKQQNGFNQYDYSPFNRNSFSNSSILYSSTATTPTNHPRTTSMVEQRPATFQSNSIWSNTISNESSSASSFYATRSVSHSASFRPTLNLSAMDHESAIVDDDENDMFEEDFVPSSLSDLLTPQELKRRGSRPSGSRSNLISSLQNGELIHSSSDLNLNDHETQFKMDDFILKEQSLTS